MPSLSAALGAEPRLEVLSNGLTVCLLDGPGTGLVSTVLLYRAGTLVEPPGQEGIAHFLEHMMFRGSARYPSGEVDRLTLTSGGSNNAFTSHDCAVFHFSFAADRWKEALSIEADRMRGLILDAEDVATEAGVILEEIALHEEDPWSVLEQRVRAACYGGHGYGRSILGLPESVSGIGSAELDRFHSLHYGPENAFLVVAGDAGRDALGTIRSAFEGLEGRHANREEIRQRASGEPPSLRADHLQLRGGDVARFLASALVPEATHPDHVPLRLLAAVLGTGRSSRLSSLLVDELQLCSGIGCDVSETVESGCFSLDAEVVPGVSHEEVEQRVFDEVVRVGRELVTLEELERVRTVLWADWIFTHERVLERALTLGLTIGQFGSEYLHRFSSDLAACDADRLLEVGRRYLAAEASWVVGWSLPESA